MNTLQRKESLEDSVRSRLQKSLEQHINKETERVTVGKFRICTNQLSQEVSYFILEYSLQRPDNNEWLPSESVKFPSNYVSNISSNGMHLIKQMRERAKTSDQYLEAVKRTDFLSYWSTALTQYTGKSVPTK